MAALYNGPPGPQPNKSLSNKKGLGWALACKWETRGPLLEVTGSDPDPAHGGRAEMILSQDQSMACIERGLHHWQPLG